jgi:hypothetical protein
MIFKFEILVSTFLIVQCHAKKIPHGQFEKLVHDHLYQENSPENSA